MNLKENDGVLIKARVIAQEDDGTILLDINGANVYVDESYILERL